MNRSLFSAGLGLFLLGWAPVRADVLINEIMHHPASGATNEQFLEVLNNGPTAVNLAGWQLDGAVRLTFAAQTLAPGGYLVAVANAASFQAAHPAVANFVGNWSGFFDGGGTVRLKDAGGQTVDSVSFATDGDWSIRKIGPADAYNERGWVWAAAHDGGGSSLELVNPLFSGKLGQNWEASSAAGGTPGAANSTARTNSPPFFLEAAHFPVIPGPANAVAITARVADENVATTVVKLFWRVDATPAPAFQEVTMLDDGAHGDGTPGDGIFGFNLPAQAKGKIVEFYVTATDAEGNARTYPRTQPSLGRTANFVYQVDDATRPTSQSLYRVIMTAAEKAALDLVEATQTQSDAASSGAFVTQDGTGAELRQFVNFRNRGHGTRSHVPHNIKVEFLSEAPWKGKSGLNLNAAYPYNQTLGSAVMREAGLIVAESRLVQVLVNGGNLAGASQYGSYAANWSFNNDLIKTQQPQDVGGSLYRGIRSFDTSIAANLAWHGANYHSYTNAYFKENNFIANDWSDLIDLLAALNVTNGFAAGNYESDLPERVNVTQWMRYFAAHTLLDDQETTLGSGYGDDFGLYHGLSDPRFQLLPYDMDTLLGQGDAAGSVTDDLFRMTGLGTSHYLPAVDRFMKSRGFAPIYFQQLKELGESLFAPARMSALIDQVYAGNGVPASVADAMKNFSAQRTAWVLAQIPTTLTVGSSLPVSNGFPRTTTSTVTLFGSANALATSLVRVNGVLADYVAWQGRWTNAAVTLHPGLNRVGVQSSGRGLQSEPTTYDVWYDDGSVSSVGGAVAANTTWTAANGPYLVSSSLTINSGVTLTIEPGTTVYLGAGVNLTVANGGRLLAEGATNAPIRFGRQPGVTAAWGGMIINGAVGSPETRIANAFFEGNTATCIEVAGGTVFFDRLNFGTTDRQYLALDGASFVLNRCVFPTTTAAFELVHGTGGIKAGGHGIVRECFFGSTTGYNDIMDFTGGNRPGQPIIQYFNNVLVGGSDDGLDLDGTDAWIEGNIFLHIHKNGAPDSSSAVSGGDNGGQTSEITMIGNLFFDCDQAATAKQGNFFTLLNNTIVHTTKTGGVDSAASVVNPQDRDPGPPTTYGRGFYLEGNIVVDAEQLVRNYDAAQTTVTWNRNMLPVVWSGPGSGNIIADPQLVHVPTVAETQFTTWEQAQVLREWFQLQSGSPARGAGPNGRDLGGVIPPGVSVSGAPTGTTNATSATLTVGLLRTGSGIPTAGFPGGSGFTHYKWRLNGESSPWSAETPINTPLTLTGLTNGSYQVQVIGRNDAGTYQDDPLLGAEAFVTTLFPWTVDTSYVPPAPATLLRLNEVLARNDSFVHGPASYPDLVELYNGGDVTLDLTGFSLTTTPNTPAKFLFPAGSTLAPGGYLVLYGGNADGTAGLHLGFKLNGSGDALFLFDAKTNQLDRVAFGPQLPDLSIGRGPDGVWRLNQPSFGAANVTVPLGDPQALKLNEWLAAHGAQPVADFIELYNPASLPVDLSGLFLANAPADPTQSPLPPLSFIAANGFSVFQADGTGPGNDRLNFTLAPEAGAIFLSAPDRRLIDVVVYGPQTNDVSQGRAPNGGSQVVAFVSPSPGGGNPSANTGGGGTNITTTTLPLIAITNVWKYWQNGDQGTAWRAAGFNDGAWPSGPALLYVETAALPAPKNTALTLGKTTYYFRTHFNFTSDPAGARLALQTVVDDGAIFWLNGQELHRLGLAAGTATYATDANRNVGDALFEGPFDLPVTALQQGDNVLAVEVHQSGATSSDIVFGAVLDGKFSVTNSVPPTDLVAVVLNEILAHNYGLAETDGTYPDWVELHNPNTVAVSVAGLSLTDDLVAGRKFTFANGTLMAPHGFLRLRCDSALPASPTNSGFTFDQDGASLFLVDSSARGGTVLDSVTFGLQVADRTLARVPDGAGAWTLGTPTPGAPNAGVPLTTADAVKVNEWMANPSAGDDWFELFNTAAVAADLSGCHLTDDLAVRTKFTLPPLSFIGSGPTAFTVFHADNNPQKGVNHVNFKLSSKGDDIGLFAPDGVQLDAVTFGPQAVDVSEGRLPDGGTLITKFPTLPTPGLPNLADADRDGIADDWELAHGLDPKNPNDAALDADGDGRSNLAEFIAGTDPKDAAGALELNFTALSGTGAGLSFVATPGHAYTWQGADNLNAGSWQNLSNVPARPRARVIDLSDLLNAQPARFYRLLVGPEAP